MSANASGNRDVVELWGREFNIVKSGLSEAQVVSFVNDLAKQHDVLLQRQEHLAALTKLAERTVSEADRLAEEMKGAARNEAAAEVARIVAETEARANADAARVVAEAEAEFEARIKEREAQVKAAAAEQAAAIKAEARRQAEETKSEAERLSNEVMAEAEEKASRSVKEAEARGRHIIEQKEAEAVKLAGDRAKAILEKAEREASTMLEREKKRVQPELNQFVQRFRGQLMSDLDRLRNQVGALEAGLEQTMSKTQPDPIETGRGGRHADSQDEFLDLVGGGIGDDSGEPEWDIEVVPPIDIMKIMNIVSHLDGIPEVKRTEIIPRNDRTSITVWVNEPVQLLELIKGLPEVAHADETGSPGNGKSRKISVSLSLKNEVAESL